VSSPGAYFQIFDAKIDQFEYSNVAKFEILAQNIKAHPIQVEDVLDVPNFDGSILPTDRKPRPGSVQCKALHRRGLVLHESAPMYQHIEMV
jgi:hypothetical protein